MEKKNDLGKITSSLYLRSNQLSPATKELVSECNSASDAKHREIVPPLLSSWECWLRDKVGCSQRAGVGLRTRANIALHETIYDSKDPYSGTLLGGTLYDAS
jgi:hypothetical protein